MHRRMPTRAIRRVPTVGQIDIVHGSYIGLQMNVSVHSISLCSSLIIIFLLSSIAMDMHVCVCSVNGT